MSVRTDWLRIVEAGMWETIQWNPQPLHAEAVADPSILFIPVLTITAAATALLLGLALAAFFQRGSRSYLLIVGAFAALFARSAVASISYMGYLSPTDHHLLEHGLDIVMVALVVAAVYLARSADPSPA